MMYRALVLCLLFAMFLAGASGAQETVDQVTRRLEQQGFTVVAVERTLLGRVMIRAENERETREVVIDPATGEILRDYTEEKGGSSALEPPASPWRRSAAVPVPRPAEPARGLARPVRISLADGPAEPPPRRL
jgi:hypothetical protein